MKKPSDRTIWFVADVESHSRWSLLRIQDGVSTAIWKYRKLLQTAPCAFLYSVVIIHNAKHLKLEHSLRSVSIQCCCVRGIPPSDEVGTQSSNRSASTLPRDEHLFLKGNAEIVYHLTIIYSLNPNGCFMWTYIIRFNVKIINTIIFYLRKFASTVFASISSAQITNNGNDLWFDALWSAEECHVDVVSGAYSLTVALYLCDGLW